MADRAELQRTLAAEFEAQSWPYDHEVGPAILNELERRGATDGATLARQVTTDYLDRNAISRERMAKVLDRALGGKTIEASAPSPTTLIINDHSHSINIGAGATVTDSQLNTGNQLIVQSDTAKDAVLAAVETLVRAGLAGNWSKAAARDLAEVIDSRDDITIEDVREVTAEVAEQGDKATRVEKAKSLLMRIATEAASGALGIGIAAGLGGLF